MAHVPRSIGEMVSWDVPVTREDGKASAEWYQAIFSLFNYSGLAGERFKMWRSASLSGTSFIPDATLNPTLTVVKAPMSLYGFSAANIEQVHGAITLPGDYVDGTDLYPFVRWSPAITNTGNIVWAIHYSVAEERDSDDARVAMTAAAEIVLLDAGGGIALANQVAEIDSTAAVATIPGKGYRSGDTLLVTIERTGDDAADTYTGAGYLLEAGFHYMAGVPGKTGRAQ